MLLLVIILVTHSNYGFVHAYSPNAEVKAAHNIPHLDRNLKKTDVDISASVDYATSIIVFPTLVLAISIFFCFLFLVALLCRCCVRSCSFCCKRGNLESTNNIEEEKVQRRKIVEILLMIFLFSAACIDTFLFYGNSKATNAFLDIANAISILIDWLKSFTPPVRDILRRIILITRVVLSSSCADYSSSLIINNLSYINSAANSMQSFVDKIIEPLKNIEDSIRGTGVEKKDLVIGLLFGIIMFTIILQSVALFVRSEFLYRLTAGAIFLAILPLFIAGSLTMIVIMLLADLCIDPNGNLNKLFSGDIASAINYYATCAGSNPFQVYIDNILNALNTVRESSMVSDSQCATFIHSNYTGIYNDTRVLTTLISCDYPHRIYSSAVLDGVCTNGFAGIYDIWVIIYLVAAFLFVILCLGNLVYAHYGLHLSVQPMKEAIIEGDDANNDDRVVFARRDSSYRSLAICDHDPEAQQTELEMVPIPEGHENKPDNFANTTPPMIIDMT